MEHSPTGMFQLWEALRGRSSTTAGAHRSHPMEHVSLSSAVLRILIFWRIARNYGLHALMGVTPARSRRPLQARFSLRLPGLGTGDTLLTSESARETTTR